ncbi:MAG: hypothetical protein RL318_870 [Fibrobacterota bacterium]|jgi:peptide/nickel transport system substrate-binding protein
MRKVLLVACGLSLLSLGACRKDSTNAASGNRIVLAQWGGPKTLNPIVENEKSSSMVSGLIFNGLTSTDGTTGFPKPELAESWTTDKAGLVWTFKLRPGLKFNDGSPLTSHDVVFTWTKLVYDTAVLCAMRDILRTDGKLPEVKALDSVTVEFRLPKPFAPFAQSVGGVPILSSKHLANRTGAGFNAVYGISTPPDSLVGAGSYKMVKFVPGSRILFVRNPFYWKKDAQGKAQPYIDTVIYEIVQGQEAELLKFKTGEIDAIEDVSPRDFPVLKPLEEKNGFAMHKLGPTFKNLYVVFNQNTGLDSAGVPFVAPTKSAWFRDVAFRRAVSFAIDRKAIRNIAWNGLGVDANGPYSPSIGYYHNKALPPLVKSLDSAKIVLKAAGYTWDAKGGLKDPKGNDVVFNLITNAENKVRLDIAGLVRKDLEAIGMKVNFTQLEFNSVVAMMDASFKWDAILLGLTGGGSDPHFGANVWISSGRTHIWFPRQKTPATPWEAELDRLVDQGVSTIDTAGRKKIYDRLQEIVRTEQPFVYLGHEEAIGAVKNRFENLKPTMLGGILNNFDSLRVRATP